MDEYPSKDILEKNHCSWSLSPLNLKRISSIKPGTKNVQLKHTPFGDLRLDCHKKGNDSSFTDSYTRMEADKISPTITTKFTSITNGRFGHYDIKQNRALSVKEGMLLQTFPENYVFYPENSLSFPSILIGNAVPPKIATFFGKYISDLI
ncbi:MAG: DNA cytosine methyltransferase [Candidatus Puniceispirillaceae bacterium]